MLPWALSEVKPASKKNVSCISTSPVSDGALLTSVTTAPPRVVDLYTFGWALAPSPLILISAPNDALALPQFFYLLVGANAESGF